MTEQKPKKDFGRKEFEYLCDIDEAIEEIETHPRFAEGKAAWDSDKYYRGWCYLQLARIGEAANYLCKPEYGDYQNKHPDIPWQKIKGMRTILVHVYWGIDDELGWSAIEKLPELKERIKTWVEQKEHERSKEPAPNSQANKLKDMLEQKNSSEQKVEGREGPTNCPS